MLVARRVAACGIDLELDVVDSVDSTNAALLRAVEPIAPVSVRGLVAREQTAGRGRRGRAWRADPESSLIVSLAIDRPSSSLAGFEGLALAIGVGLAGAARELRSGSDDGLALKWPNDLLLDGRKTAGILIEARSWADRCRLVIGVGVNLDGARLRGVSIDQPVAGVLDGIDRVPDHDTVAVVVIAALLDALVEFERAGLAAFTARWQRLDAFAGQAVSVREGDVRVDGIARGIDERGALRIETEGKIRVVMLGDASLRPAEGRS